MGFWWLNDTPQNWALGALQILQDDARLGCWNTDRSQTGRESERGKANDHGMKGNEIMHGIDLGL